MNIALLFYTLVHSDDLELRFDFAIMKAVLD